MSNPQKCAKDVPKMFKTRFEVELAAQETALMLAALNGHVEVALDVEQQLEIVLFVIICCFCLLFVCAFLFCSFKISREIGLEDFDQVLGARAISPQQVLQCLSEAGANLNLLAHDGLDALRLASEAHHVEVKRVSSCERIFDFWWD